METPNTQDMWVLLLATVRYSMGRMTYMTSYAPELVLRYQEYLTDWQLEQIQDEVAREIEFHNNIKKDEHRNGPLGHECDYYNWVNFVACLERLLKKRKEADIKE